MPIGAFLISSGQLTQLQLDKAVAEQRVSGERLDKILIRLGMVGKEQVLRAIGDQFHIPVVDIDTIEVEPATLGTLPSKLVFKQRCVPIKKTGSVLTVATSDPYEISVLDELRLLTGCTIDLVLADEDSLSKFIRANYGVGGDTLDAMAGSIGTAALEVKPTDEAEQAQEASVIKLVNDILTEGIEVRATDVHIEPYEHDLIVRYRVDGVLERANVSAAISRYAPAIISRLKIMASLNIAEKRKPQDGRITFKFRPPGGGPIREYDLRVSVIPMLFGEGVVLRILSKTAVLLSLDDLGMPITIRPVWEHLIARPHGMLLVTGPTGSGKSTTLYASLNKIVSDEIKVITVEDPVEYHVTGVNQIQVNHKVGLDFAAGLRAILRHDPDVVMIGEIRDKETAETAIQASLTGHMVFSTLHTNDSAGAVTRLLDMGVEPFLVSSSLEGVIAQRLVRRNCPDCTVAYTPNPDDLPTDFPFTDASTLKKGQGCRTCRQSGYRGRLGVYEILEIDDALRHMVIERASSPALVSYARGASRLRTLLEDGYTKVNEGRTTLEEVLTSLSE